MSIAWNGVFVKQEDYCQILDSWVGNDNQEYFNIDLVTFRNIAVREQVNDVLDGFNGFAVGYFEFSVQAVGGIGLVVKLASGQWAAC